MNQLIILHFFTGSTLLAIGLLMKLWPPKKINNFYGYRTPRSMKNQLAWNEANSFSAELLVWAGVSTVIVELICYMAVGGYASLLIAVGYFLVFAVLILVLTERRLKAKGF